MTVITKDQEPEVVRLYQEGEHSTAIADIYGCSVGPVLRVLRKHGVPIRGYPKAFTKAERADIIARYEAGEPVLSIALSYGYEQTMTIYRVLNRAGIEIRGQNGLTEEQEGEIISRFQDGGIVTDLATEYDASLPAVRNLLDRVGLEREEKRSKYQLDIHTFDEIDNEGKAYALGFIYADGCVSENRLRIQLKRSDIEILASIRDVLKSNAPIRKVEKKHPRKKVMLPVASYEAHSQHMADRLQEIGIVSRRSNFHLTQAVLPKHLVRHFIRGFMDGDGSLTQSRNNPMIRFYGQEDILAWIREVFCQELETNPELTIRQKAGIKVIAFCGGRQCRKLVRWLYKDATIWLPRKHEIAMSWLEKGRA